jgi:hypothetical protein
MEVTDYIPHPKTPEKLSPEWWDRQAQASSIWRSIEPNLNPTCKLYQMFISALAWKDNEEPSAEDLNLLIISFYRLPAAERARLLNGWSVQDEYHRPAETYRKDIVDMNRYPVLVLRPQSRSTSANLEMKPREFLTPVELHIERGAKRDEVLAALSQLIDAVKKRWGQLTTDPQDEAGMAEEAARQLLSPAKKGSAK